jgi:hypothetical protein
MKYNRYLFKFIHILLLLSQDKNKKNLLFLFISIVIKLAIKFLNFFFKKSDNTIFDYLVDNKY